MTSPVKTAQRQCLRDELTEKLLLASSDGLDLVAAGAKVVS